MPTGSDILGTIASINKISNVPKYKFDEKIRIILLKIMDHMNAQKGSIMIVKGKKHLEIAASENEELLGLKLPLESESPSCWVYHNKRILYSEEIGPFNSKHVGRYSKNAFVISPIMINGKVIGVINITEKIGPDTFSKAEQEALLILSAQVISALETKRLTENLERKKATLVKKNKELKHLQELRDDFTNMLVHDLKGPISEISANLDILSYTAEGESQEYVKSAQTGCDNLFYMVSNLLDIARIEEGELGLILERIDPAELIKEAAARVHVQARFKSVTIVQEIPENKKHFISGDRGMLLRVFQNLLINSINHSPEEDRVMVGYDFTGNGQIVFFVSNNGPEITPDDSEVIFEKYKSLSESSVVKSYSVGLGLTFCKTAINAHKGDISVDLERTRGCCFKFHLPLIQRR